MAIFVIIHQGDMSKRLQGALKGHLGNDFYQVGSNTWLASFDGTSRQLYETFDKGKGPFNQTLVVSISGYWGKLPNDVWEWIQAKWEGSSSG